MKRLLCLPMVMFAALSPAPLLAEDMPEDTYRRPLFVCGFGEEASEGFLELSGLEDVEGGGPFTKLQFQLADRSSTLIRIPAEGDDTPVDFRFSHNDGPEGYLVSVRFTQGDIGLWLFSLAIPPDPAVADDGGGGEAGLEITAVDGTTTFIPCDERPEMYIEYMRRAMACDDTGALGAAACGENPPLRKAGMPLF